MTLTQIINAIRPGDPALYRKAMYRWDGLAKPLGSLGVLERDIAKIAALTGREDVRLDRRVLVVVCADNGVVAQGISQSGSDVTRAVAAALGSGRSTVNRMANAAECAVLPVDAGMAAETPSGVRNCKIRSGTDDISMGPAMRREECLHGILLGVSLAGEQADSGANILLLGEMGIGNTTTATAVSCVLLDRNPTELTGRGAGLSDEGLSRKIQIIRQAVSVSRPDPADPVDVLRKVGGLDLSVLCGLCLGGALYRIPVLLDGMITDAAALCALRLCPNVHDTLIASHTSVEPAAADLLRELRLEPLISAGLRLGEGSGAVLALPLLDQALTVYHSGHTFDALGIDAYTPQ